MVFNDEDLIGDGVYDDNEDEDKISENLSFYSSHTLVIIDMQSAIMIQAHMYTQLNTHGRNLQGTRGV